MTVSIVVPIYNDVSHVKRCFDSILAQDCPKGDFEVVVVDDCSNDGSLELISTYKDRIESLKTIKSDVHRNCGGARNLGVENASGEYIAFIDSDDFIEPRYVSEICDAARKFNSPDVIDIPYDVLRPNAQPEMHEVKFNKIEEGAFGAVAPWAQIIKREKYVKMPEGTLSEDTAWHYLQFDNFDTFGKVDGNTPIYHYDRTNKNAISETVAWCGSHSMTLVDLALSNHLIGIGLRDKWISDVIRNLANMYDVRNQLKKKWVIDAWIVRFKGEYANFMTSHFVH